MELTLSEIKPIIKYIIENNKNLGEQGKSPVSLNIVSTPGVGKSALCEEIAKEIGANYIFLSLSQIAEPAEIIGFPVREHYVCRTYSNSPEKDECAWIAAELIESYVKAGWEVTPKTRMGYAIPQWMVGLDLSRPTIMLLDDYTRSTPAIMQAIMQIIYKQEYISWKLPPNSTILLTSNSEEDGSNVVELDEAQKTRLVNFNVRFDVKDWANWAERNAIDNKAINFMLAYSDELMQKTKNGAAIMNARSYTTFANIIGGLANWDSSENLAFIMQIASGCFLDKENIVGGLFTQFIHNKLDKLISPQDMLLQDWNKVKERIKECVYQKGEYRPDVASILGTRLLNYSCVYFEQKDSKTDVVKDRLLELIRASNDPKTKLFTEDILFGMIRVLLKKFPARCNRWITEKEMQGKVI